MAGKKSRIMYVECKASEDHRGGARICRVTFSQSGNTIYSDGRVLRRIKRGGIYGNFMDANTGTEYWVSGPKRNGEDRHWAGGGTVRIDADVVDEYWAEIRKCDPPVNPFIA